MVQVSQRAACAQDLNQSNVSKTIDDSIGKKEAGARLSFQYSID